MNLIKGQNLLDKPDILNGNNNKAQTERTKKPDGDWRTKDCGFVREQRRFSLARLLARDSDRVNKDCSSCQRIAKRRKYDLIYGIFKNRSKFGKSVTAVNDLKIGAITAKSEQVGSPERML